MRLAGCACLLCVVAGFTPATYADDTKPVTPKPAATKPAPPAPKEAAADDDFLEFLGSVDAEGADEDWLDYLARTDIEKVAKAKKPPPDTEAKK